MFFIKCHYVIKLGDIIWMGHVAVIGGSQIRTGIQTENMKEIDFLADKDTEWRMG
jgi:hypothetical protein